MVASPGGAGRAREQLRPQDLAQAHAPAASSVLLPPRRGRRGPGRVRAPCSSQGTHPSLLGKAGAGARGLEPWERWEHPHSCTSAGAAPAIGNHEYSPSISTGWIQCQTFGDVTDGWGGGGMDWERPSLALAAPPAPSPSSNSRAPVAPAIPGALGAPQSLPKFPVQVAKPWGPLEMTFQGGAAPDLWGLVARNGWAPPGTGVAWPGTAPVSPWVCWR